MIIVMMMVESMMIVMIVMVIKTKDGGGDNCDYNEACHVHEIHNNDGYGYDYIKIHDGMGDRHEHDKIRGDEG